MEEFLCNFDELNLILAATLCSGQYFYEMKIFT